jgi:hypothetical protein
MNPQDLKDWASIVYESGDGKLGDILDDCYHSWNQDRERIAELEQELKLVEADTLKDTAKFVGTLDKSEHVSDISIYLLNKANKLYQEIEEEK